MVRAWETLYRADLPEAVRRKVDNLSYVDNHVANTSKTFDDVANELPLFNGDFVKWVSWNNIWIQVDELLTGELPDVRAIFPNAKIGCRGSVVTGWRYSAQTHFNPESFDVDAFIVDDEFAALWGGFTGFRDASEKSTAIEIMSEELDLVFRGLFPGYRIDPDDPFAYRVWTEAEFQERVVPDGYKLFE
jgi:hypothetical protein